MNQPRIRTLDAGDLEATRALFRKSFATFLRVPERMMDDSDFVGPRSLHTESIGLAAELDGELQGAILWMRRGSVAILGPIVVKPGLWSKGTGRALVEASLQVVDERWKPALKGLFTFPNSPLHLHFFGRHGFEPGHLVASMVRPVPASASVEIVRHERLTRVMGDAREALLTDIGQLTGRIFPGLDVRREAEGIVEGKLGEVMVLKEGGCVSGVAICHVGAGTEAGTGSAAIRFAALAPELSHESNLASLLNACEHVARELGATKLKASVNSACRDAYRAMGGLGFRTEMLGVWLQEAPEGVGYHHRNAWVLDDGR